MAEVIHGQIPTDGRDPSLRIGVADLLTDTLLGSKGLKRGALSLVLGVKHPEVVDAERLLRGGLDGIQFEPDIQPTEDGAALSIHGNRLSLKPAEPAT